VNLKFLELDLDWPPELSVYDLREYILVKLSEYGEPLRWAITSVNDHYEKNIQMISLEVVLITNQDKGKGINSELN
tara:strand:- start:85 stop:312 length:228 start_codon:yes stop_codon:yes gene_type:complete